MMGEFMQKRNHWSLLAALVAPLLVLHSACKEENTAEPPGKKPTVQVFDLQAYSKNATSVGLKWNLTADTSRADYKEIIEIQIRVRTTPDNILLYTLRVAKDVKEHVVEGLLDEGKIYTFEVVTVPSVTSTEYKESDPVSIRWAGARPLGPFDVFEIGSPTNASGLQFFDGGTLNGRVLSIGPGLAQQVIDVLVDTNVSGNIILESAHRNPLREPGVPVRTTRFSTLELDASDLNVARSSPPDTTTYIRESVLIFPSQVQAGRILYAVTNDKNYVRILVQRNDASPPTPGAGTLLFGSPPNRRVRLLLSYQTIPNNIYARPQGEDVPQPAAGK